MPSCQLCNSRHDSEAGVVQHIFASEGGDHAQYDDKGEVWKNSGELVDHDTPGNNESGDNDSDAPSGESTPDPVMGNAAPDGGDNDNDNDDVELPCGHESFDPANAPEPPFEVSCEQCGEAWTVTEL